MNPSDIQSILSETERGVAFQCRVQPRSSRTAFIGVHGEALKIALKAPPVDGKANAELTKFLGKTLGVPKAAVSILRGQSGRNKTIAIEGVSRSDAARAFA